MPVVRSTAAPLSVGQRGQLCDSCDPERSRHEGSTGSAQCRGGPRRQSHRSTTPSAFGSCRGVVRTAVRGGSGAEFSGKHVWQACVCCVAGVCVLCVCCVYVCVCVHVALCVSVATARSSIPSGGD